MNNDLVSAVRSKVDIVDIIGERIPLVARGKNFFGVCPFHDDTNPSLSVSREKQIYTCFSCHATGNVFTFLMNYEHIDFKQALKYLGDKVGIDTSDISLKYFQNNLNSKAGHEAKKYLLNRKIDENLIKEFEIGLSLPNKDDLTKLLSSKEYDLVTLNRIGLSSDDHDIYNDRIMFPLYDISGKCVGFSGRIYKDNGQNKYLNTKETEIFKNALTREQINLIKRLSNNIILCLDGDDPGQHATLNIGNMLQDIGIETKVIKLPNPEDPDSYILKNGKERFEGLIESAINFSDYKMDSLKKNVNFKSNEETANYIEEVLKETAKLDDSIRREVILKRLAKEFDIGYNTLEMRINSLLKEKKEKPIVNISKKIVSRKDKYAKAYEQIIYFMLNNDWVITKVENERLIFPTEIMRLTCNEIIYYYKKYGYINIADFYTYIQDKEDILNFLNNILGEDYVDGTNEEELEQYFKVAHKFIELQEIKRLTNLMKKEVDPLEQAKISEKIRKLRLGDS